MTCQFGKFKFARAALLFSFLSSLLLLLPTKAAANQSVTFGWEPSADPSVAGYNIYYGTVSLAYTNKVSVGGMTSATIGGLVEGRTYYFAATTYDALNVESVFSDEIAYTVPLPVTNTPPVITQMPTTITAIAGQGVDAKISATGTGPFSYSLGAGAPAGAAINPATGQFAWSPQITQAGTTNVIPVIVTESANPPLSTTQTFSVVVLDYIHLSIGSTVVATNSGTGVTLAVYASTPLTNLQFRVNYPSGLLSNLSVSSTNSLIGLVSVTPIAPGQALIVVETGVGSSLIGTQMIGAISFQSVTASKTAYAYLTPNQVLASKPDGSLANFVTADSGRVTVVGQDSMVEACLAGGVRSLNVYGPTGASYQVEACNALGGSGGWVNAAATFTMTNLCQTILLPPDTNSATFYRTRKVP